MQPLFSVVVPSRDRPAVLAKVLAAYERQLPTDLPFEVVVVDDGSGEETYRRLHDWRSSRFTLRWAHQEPSGPAAARNRALRLARGQLILFTGDDIEPAVDLLERHRWGHRQRDDPRVAILGLVAWSIDLPLTTTMRHVDGPGAQQFSYLYMRDGASYDFRHFYTSNVSLRRVFLDHEPSYFSTDFSAAAFEDAELAYRLSRHGLKIVYHPKARAVHHHRYTARGFFKRQIRCGRMAVILADRYPELRGLLRLESVYRSSHGFLASLRRRRLRSLTATLSAHEEAALGVAEELDPLCTSAADAFLLDLFAYAYQKGAAERVQRDGQARASLAELFDRTVRRSLAAAQNIVGSGGSCQDGNFNRMTIRGDEE